MYANTQVFNFGVLTLLPSGLLPILLQIFSKFRVHFAYFEVGIT